MSGDDRAKKQAAKQNSLSHSELLEMLAYDPDTGGFTWRVRRGGGPRAGAPAGGLRNDGYHAIKLRGLTFLSHRLAWLYVHGVWPKDELDHADRDRANNRLANLREASRADNCRNKAVRPSSKTGVKGVWPHGDRYRAEIHVDGRQRCLGVYGTVSEARDAYLAESAKVHGKFAASCQQ